MDKFDFVLGQKVKAVTLDTLEDNIERADDSQYFDGNITGVLRGLDVLGTGASGQVVNVQVGALANKPDGRTARISLTVGNFDITNAGANSPPVGSKTFVALFGEPIKVVQSGLPGDPDQLVEGLLLTTLADGDVSPEATDPDTMVRPTPQANKVLLADVLLRNVVDKANIDQFDISYTRRDVSILAQQSGPPDPLEIREKDIRRALVTILDALGSSATFAAGPPVVQPGARLIGAQSVAEGNLVLAAGTIDGQLANFFLQLAGVGGNGANLIDALVHTADHFTVNAATVFAQLADIVAQLGNEATGATVVGAAAQAFGGESLTAGTIAAQLLEIITSLDGKLAGTVTDTFLQSVETGVILAGAPTFNPIGRWESTSGVDAISIVLTGIAEGNTINSVRVRVLGDVTNTCSASVLVNSIDNVQAPIAGGATSVGAGAQWLSIIAAPHVIATGTFLTIQWLNDGVDANQVELRSVEYTIETT